MQAKDVRIRFTILNTNKHKPSTKTKPNLKTYPRTIEAGGASFSRSVVLGMYRLTHTSTQLSALIPHAYIQPLRGLPHPTFRSDIPMDLLSAWPHFTPKFPQNPVFPPKTTQK